MFSDKEQCLAAIRKEFGKKSHLFDVFSLDAEGWAAFKAARKRKFKVLMTGQTFKPDMNIHFVGTVALDGGAFVVHVFEIKRISPLPTGVYG